MLESAECVTSCLAAPGSRCCCKAALLSQHELVSHTGKDTFQFLKCSVAARIDMALADSFRFIHAPGFAEFCVLKCQNPFLL